MKPRKAPANQAQQSTSSMRTVEVTADPDINPSMILRRYIDLPKFVDLLYSRTLYLRRADGFPDRFEGALTPAMRSAMDEAYKSGKTDKNADYFYRRCRLGNFVSCWTIGSGDSMALWQLYGGLRTCLAITTTVKKLIGVALSFKEPSLVHRVKYINHVDNPDMIVGQYSDMLQYKHESYAYENELRLIVPRQHDGWDNNPTSLRLPLANLNDLVRSVVVAPEAEDWFFDAVIDLTRRYELKTPVRRSKLAFMQI